MMPVTSDEQSRSGSILPEIEGRLHAKFNRALEEKEDCIAIAGGHAFALFLSATRRQKKEHWEDRIGKRIEHRIEALVSKEAPMFLQRLAEQARQRGYEDLGIDAQEHIENKGWNWSGARNV